MQRERRIRSIVNSVVLWSIRCSSFLPIIHKTFAAQKSIVCYEPTAVFPLHFPHTNIHTPICISSIILSNLFLLSLLWTFALGFPCTLRFSTVIRIKRTTLYVCVWLFACVCVCVCTAAVSVAVAIAWLRCFVLARHVLVSVYARSSDSSEHVADPRPLPCVCLKQQFIIYT